MHLLCRVCGATQPVNLADEADEDLRTQSIRRSFRTEHLTCGDGAVSLQLHAINTAPPVDFSPPAWMTDAPAGVTLGGDGFFTNRNGHRVCEDCWQPIPRYVDFPLGLTSPESHKPRATHVDSHAAYEQLRKAVCLPCYLLAFMRVYPEAELPVFRSDVIGDARLQQHMVDAHQTTVDAGYFAEPKLL
jgi:hypothetical protein